MKNRILIALLFSAFYCNAADYWSISTNTWSNTDGGADCLCSPGNLTTGDNVYVKHYIDSPVMTLSGTPSVTIYSAGRWTLTGGAMDINAGSWTINSGGTLKVSDGDLTSGGFTTFAINGRLEAVNLTNSGAITGAGIISYSGGLVNTGTIAPLTALPVSLIDFNATQSSGVAEIKWSTASEISSDYFTVLRSTNAADFESVAIVKAQGNSEFIVNYSCIDQLPVTDLVYYQLVETDINGSTQKSKIIALQLQGSLDLASRVYPNPAVEETNVIFSTVKAGFYKLQLSNVDGQILYAGSTYALEGENSVVISLGEYTDNFYVLTLSNSDNVSSRVQIVKK